MTVVQLRSKVLPRSKSAHENASDDFRDDVLEYGGILYESLRRRRDFGSAVDRVREREVRHQKRLDRDVETDF